MVQWYFDPRHQHKDRHTTVSTVWNEKCYPIPHCHKFDLATEINLQSSCPNLG